MQPSGTLAVLDAYGQTIWTSSGYTAPPFLSNLRAGAELLVGAVGMVQGHENFCLTDLRTQSPFDLEKSVWPTWCAISLTRGPETPPTPAPIVNPDLQC
ncbi:hypothetical protein BV898_13000 [Hypsibius exemplaris]|uniref:Uncharacterized protein n=1 Tax=Hypsibius exemplaris TaxID=2072580 RepID=A0A1W0WC39_HYPEX|nr:hypothetical protein BV898_13000 [Hypsibius exemplaris]